MSERVAVAAAFSMRWRLPRAHVARKCPQMAIRMVFVRVFGAKLGLHPNGTSV